MTEFTKELRVKVFSGWLVLAGVIAMYLAAAGLVYWFIHNAAQETLEVPHIVALVVSVLVIVLASLCCNGFFTLQPNAARVLILFGHYVGTVRDSGFHWTNPFNTKQRVSLRSRNFNTPTLKVNDKQGNPIEIGAVVVWRVENSAQASFDVDNYEDYVEVQSEAAVRQLAIQFAYDHGEEEETTLRSGMAEVSNTLQNEVQARLAKAGVQVEEARISHLAYAQEIAGAMLRRQQADAIIAAREKIVHGAVSMVEMALRELEDGKIVHLDDERKAAMIGNLLVVLCSEAETHPVLNTGTLYN